MAEGKAGSVHPPGLHVGDGHPELHSCCPADEGLWDMFAKDIPQGATAYTVSLDQLRQGVTYEFRVVAVNQAGYGEPSSPSAAVSGRSPARGPWGVGGRHGPRAQSSLEETSWPH